MFNGKSDDVGGSKVEAGMLVLESGYLKYHQSGGVLYMLTSSSVRWQEVGGWIGPLVRVIIRCD